MVGVVVAGLLLYSEEQRYGNKFIVREHRHSVLVNRIISGYTVYTG